MKIYSLWVKGPLSPLNYLSVRSFQAHGHEVVVYSFDPSIDPGCEVQDANQIFSEKEIYVYKHLIDSHKLGGITERLKAEMLYQLGGWNICMDVVCFKPFDFSQDYVFRPHPQGVVGNIIRAPKGSDLAKRYVDWTKTIDENNTDYEKSFRGLAYAVQDLGLQRYIVDQKVFGTDDKIWWAPLLQNNGVAPHKDCYAIHFCGAMKYYETYAKGSFYDSLLQKYNIL